MDLFSSLNSDRKGFPVGANGSFRRSLAELTSRAQAACLERAGHSEYFTDGAPLARNRRRQLVTHACVQIICADPS
jgi:hypothetical protein